MASLCRSMVIGSAFFTTSFAYAATITAQGAVTPTREDVHTISLDSKAKGMIRREQIDKRENEKEWKTSQALLAEIAVGEAAEAVAHHKQHSKKATDLYVLVGKNICNGEGGLWKRYELNVKGSPGRYDYCAAACDAKDECVGFDVGRPGCNMYTQKAVAVGTWPGVRFNDANPFDGEGAHNRFPSTPSELVAGNDVHENNDMYQCYRKTFYKPADSYYWLIGHGTCSGGGLWKRYTMTPGTFATCENACNQRDECIGFDVGRWQVSDDTTQVNGATMFTSLVTTPGCFMYTQKPVYGTWPFVEDNENILSGENDHDAFPESPYDLKAAHVAKYEVGGDSKCYGKSHWVGLDQYYMMLGKQFCTGGGTWKHYKLTQVGADLNECKTKCDMQDGCIGLDHEVGGACRLYTRIAIPLSRWPGVDHSGNGNPFPGAREKSLNDDPDPFAPDPFSLVPEAGAAVEGRSCVAKTHFDSRDQSLADADR